MKLLAAMKKDALLILRDRAGLATLFLMPLALVVIVTLVQEDAFQMVRGPVAAVVWVDLDGGVFAREMQAGLREAGSFRVATELSGAPASEGAARRAAAAGEYQAAVIVPAGLSSNLLRRLEARMSEAMLPPPAPGAAPAAGEDGSAAGRITLCFDPATKDFFRRSMLMSLRCAAQAVEFKLALETIRGMMPGGADDAGAPPGETAPAGRLVDVREEAAGRTGDAALPTSVQQNVPAWTLFAMFLVVIPLSGTIVRERELGTLMRLRTLPVPYGTILGGKMLVYVAVCLLQFGVMLLIGATLMPALGTPALRVGSDYGAILVTASVCALTATALGVLLGTIARSYDQTAVFGSTFVVIAGALGGIMVPVFLMPAGLRLLSGLSPLNWGLEAFLELFVRGGNLATAAPHLARLLALAGAAMAVAWRMLRRRD